MTESESEVGSPESTEMMTQSAEVASPSPTDPVKADALRRLKALERRGKTVGTHLDELRALLTILFEKLPD